jgi:hypothetical protein
MSKQGRSTSGQKTELNEVLKAKVTTAQVWVARCGMNQCTRGQSAFAIVDVVDTEGEAESAAEKHRNAHRLHEKKAESVLARIREERKDEPTALGDEDAHRSEVHAP